MSKQLVTTALALALWASAASAQGLNLSWVDFAVAVDPTKEYYAYAVRLQYTKSTGTGSCVGCANPACVVLNEIQLFQPADADYDPEIVNPALQSFVTWQAPTSGPPNCPFA